MRAWAGRAVHAGNDFLYSLPVWPTMSAPWPACPDCSSEDTTILHESDPSAVASHATLQCEACERVFRAVIETPKPVQVPAILSEGAESRSVEVEVPGGGRVRVGDELFGEGHRLLVTALEDADGRRVRSAPPTAVKTLWCKVFDTLTIKLAVNRGHRTIPGELTVTPEEEFFVGDEIVFRGIPIVIHAIKTSEGIRHRGGSPARDVVRLYGRPAQDESEAKEQHRGPPGGRRW